MGRRDWALVNLKRDAGPRPDEPAAAPRSAPHAVPTGPVLGAHRAGPPLRSALGAGVTALVTVGIIVLLLATAPACSGAGF
ncbi:hypothetical protein [Couchioplanes azureus]|uniref:hypothetical protein n=1 Tax=Couchioplanes caeruleus TaxID=56438 RepID=UPI001986E704|nr:hypothetical protein [Couchioplanes caeruleus]GGQ87645.1 hypothetical protein GCM10010166_67250 [Couchioplanes caeruleus subsp. azureus]